MRNHKMFRRWYWMPTTVFILAILSTFIIFWIYLIGEGQKRTYGQHDNTMVIQIETALFHLWFEEALSEGRMDDLGGTFKYLDDAIRHSDALRLGGKTIHGTSFGPFVDSTLVRQAEIVRALLIKLKQLALKRSQNPETSGVGSAFDNEMDDVFEELMEKARALELVAAKDQISDQTRERHLLFVTALLWACIVVGSIIGLYIREVQRRRAELALEEAYEEMEERVTMRTAELTNTNSQLQEEISERKKVEDCLRESESEFHRLSVQFHALLDAIPDSITLVSPELRVLWANKGATSEDEVCAVLGQYCYTLWHDASSPCQGCPALRSFQTGKGENLQISKPDGSIWDLRAFPMPSENGRIENVIEIATDITQKITLQSETLRASHLASIGELAAGVAHELNNPINGIINYARILSNKSLKGSTENDIAERIAKEGRRIAAIVKSLLAFARDRKEEKKNIRVEDIIRESLILTESQMRKEGIHLSIGLPSGLPEILANQQQIQQVFMNIISNAQYALSQKYPGEDEDKILDIMCEEIMTDKGPSIRITFHDRGIGISSDDLEKIMNPFFSTKPVGKGTGLGLSISHGIVADHGGRLAVKSVKGEYTKVMIDLPVKELRN